VQPFAGFAAVNVYVVVVPGFAVGFDIEEELNPSLGLHE
jgi:hypothetical protein